MTTFLSIVEIYLFLFDEVLDAGVGAFALDAVDVIKDATETVDSADVEA